MPEQGASFGLLVGKDTGTGCAGILLFYHLFPNVFRKECYKLLLFCNLANPFERDEKRHFL